MSIFFDLIKLVVFTLVFGVLSTKSLAADCTVTISIVDVDKGPIPGVYIEIVESGQKAVTDFNGEVIFVTEQGQQYTVKANYLGFHELLQEILVSSSNKNSFTLTLLAYAKELNQVIIKGRSEEDRIVEMPYKAQVVNMDAIRVQPTNVTTVLNNLPGARVRLNGGTGSEANIMLNGVDGKGVKIFVDEIPVYLLGVGYSINSISPSLIERVEVYKGAIPVSFGSDALGGVINLVSRYGGAEFAEMSYSYGSWNTHHGTINTRKNLGRNEHFYISLDGSYNYSDNDYWMDNVEVVVDDRLNTASGSARRFNDSFESVLGRLQMGVRDLNWADELVLMSSYSKIDKELQHGIRADIPFGAPYSIEKTKNLLLSWKKYGENDKWSAIMTVGFTDNHLHFIDTASVGYYWDQTTTPVANRGESGLYSNGTEPVLKVNSFFSRENFSYRLNQQHMLNLTMLLTQDNLSVGNRAFTQANQERLDVPQELFKNYTGIALESNFRNSAILNIFSLKHFYTTATGTNYSNNMVDDVVSNVFSIVGYGDALQYKINNHISVNLAYEFTVRQPDRTELFGDYINVAPNPGLNPEVSHNLNVSTDIQSSNEKVTTGVTFFYRDTKDRMVLNGVTYGLSQYINLIGTQTLGTEVHARIFPLQGIIINANFTYQDITLKDNGHLQKKFIGERVPNIPYLFGNGQVMYSRNAPWVKNSKVNITYDINYVNEFFPSWDQASIQANIPTQWLHSVSLSWLAPKEKWSLGFSCMNLMDAKNFDNFFVQKPGRSFNMKTRIFFNK